MAFTKQHFERIAQVVSEHGEEHGGEAAGDLALAFADYFEETEPRFDRQRFLGACEAPIYRVVRNFKSGEPGEVIMEHLTLSEAQAHCKDPETSSSTATSEEARKLTEERGDWFDGFEEVGF